jgi:ferritin-like protein
VKKPTDIGMNRTGIKASPIDSKETIEGAQQSKLVDPGDATAIADERIEWSNAAEPVGTMPPPGSVKGVLKTVMEKLKGNEPNVLLDKLGERIAFERTGVRLYDALLCKLAAANLHEGGPTREEVEQIREEELQHFMLLKETMESLGGDPTAMTPCADITAVASSGIVKVLADSRTTLTQCLDALLIAELADNDAWMMLVDLAEGLGMKEMGQRFRQAMTEEEDHLMRVRGWINAALLGQAGITPTRPHPQPRPPAH